MHKIKIHTYTCIHAKMHAYIHTYIHTYMHTHIHTYIYIYTCIYGYTHASGFDHRCLAAAMAAMTYTSSKFGSHLLGPNMKTLHVSPTRGLGLPVPQKYVEK